MGSGLDRNDLGEISLKKLYLLVRSEEILRVIIGHDEGLFSSQVGKLTEYDPAHLFLL